MAVEMSRQNVERNSAFQTEMAETQYTRMERAISAFNGSPKAITTLLLSHGAQSEHDLQEAFQHTYAHTALERMRKWNAIEYCNQTLIPQQMVVREGSDLELTTDGKRYGIAIAAGFLDFEMQTGRCLYPVFGQSLQKETAEYNAPVTRAFLLMKLYEGTLHTSKELATSLNLHPSLIGRTLARLDDLHIVTYTSTNHRDLSKNRPVVYELSNVEALVPQYENRPTLTSTVQQICTQLQSAGREITCYTVAEQINPDNNSKKWLNRISSILSHCKKHGFLQGGQQSHVELTQHGKQIVEELLHPFWNEDLFRKKLYDWRWNVYPRMMENLPKVAENTGALYLPYSRSSHRPQYAKIESTIVGLIEQSEDGVTHADIADALGVSLDTVPQLMVKLQQRRTDIRGILGKSKLTRYYKYIDK